MRIPNCRAITIKRSFVLLIWSVLLASATAQALQLVAPDVAENGAVIPVEVRLDRPLTAGQQIDLIVNGQPTAQLRVVEGSVSFFATRVKGSRNPSTITARVLAGGRETGSVSRDVTVTIPATVGGSPTPVGPIKVRNSGGDVKLLLSSENGFPGALVLQGAGFHVEVSGGASMSRFPFVGIKGNVSGEVTASLSGQTMKMADSATSGPRHEPSSSPGDDPKVVGGSYRR